MVLRFTMVMPEASAVGSACRAIRTGVGRGLAKTA